MWLARALLASALLVGCAEEETRAPFAPVADGSIRDAMVTGNPGSGRGDAGETGGDDAGMDPDAGLVGCFAIPPADPTTNLTVFQGSDRPPFELEAAFIRWNDHDCEDPTLLIGLTDGACEPGQGQQLLFAASREAIGGVITEGDYTLTSAPTSLHVTFSRPVPGSPAEREVFGTCGEVVGTITFESVGIAEGTIWQARFDSVELGPCTLTSGAAVSVEGAFRLTLEQAFEEACP